MKNYICIKNGIVQNIIVAEEQFIATNESIKALYDLCIDQSTISETVGPGYLYDGINFTAPPPSDVA